MQILYEFAFDSPYQILRRIDLIWKEKEYAILAGSSEKAHGILTLREEGMQPSSEPRWSVNRLASVLSWKTGHPVYVGGGVSGPFAGAEIPNVRRYGQKARFIRTMGELSVDYIEDMLPKTDDQWVALALYRDALLSQSDIYRTIAFYRILEHMGPERVDVWINGIRSQLEEEFIPQGPENRHLQTIDNLGKYIKVFCRHAASHFKLTRSAQYQFNPDNPDEAARMVEAASITRKLAEMYIEKEMGIASFKTIRQEHLYELRGFKRLLGDDFVRAVVAQSAELPAPPDLPNMTLYIDTTKRTFEAFKNLRFRVESVRDASVTLVTQAPCPAPIRMILDFGGERLVFEPFGSEIDRNSPMYSRMWEISYLEFLIEYICNGRLIVKDDSTGTIISKLLPYMPCNVDTRRTVERWEEEIRRLRG